MLKLRQRTQSDTEVRGPCERHGFERAAESCGCCHNNFCDECLVHPQGPNKQGMCINCALIKAGVRR